MSSKELEVAKQYLPASADAIASWNATMEGAEVEFPTVKTPKAGSTTWEVEGEDPTRTLTGVVIDDTVNHVLYLEEFSGEGNAPDALWIAGELQWLNDKAKAAGFHSRSHLERHDKLDNRQVIYLARPGRIVPLRLDLSGANVRPWRLFKQNELADTGRRTTDVVVELTLAKKDYKSGFSGSILVPKILAPLPADAAASYAEQKVGIQAFTRSSQYGVADSGERTEREDVLEVNDFQPVNAAQAADDDIPF